MKYIEHINTEVKEPQIVELKIEKETNQWWITIIVMLISTLILVIVGLYFRIQSFKKRMDLYEKTEHL